MSIIITGDSAIQFWLDYTFRFNYPSYSFNICDRVALPEEKEKVDSSAAYIVAKELGLSFPLHILIRDDNLRHKNKNICFHTKPKNLPSRSFIKLKEYQLPARLANMEVYVASPEYCFMMIAGKFEAHWTVLLGCELCARYARNRNKKYNQVFREQITTKEMIKEFLEAAKDIKGCIAAKRLIKYISEGSNSPMESKLATVFGMTYALGGFNLRGFELNKEIKYSKEGANLVKRKTCEGDIVWEDEKVVAEYDSNMTHLEIEQHAYDKGKATALQTSGYKIINITYKNVRSIRKIENLCESVQKLLNRRVNKNSFQKSSVIRENVINDLFFMDEKPFAFMKEKSAVYTALI